MRLTVLKKKSKTSMRSQILLLLFALFIFSVVLWHMPIPALHHRGTTRAQFLDPKQRLRIITSRLRALKRLRH